MFVQWCVKGIRGDEDPRLAGISGADAAAIVDDGTGILCKWWQKIPPLAVEDLRREIRQRLTLENLERHLHDYHNFGDEKPSSRCRPAVSSGRRSWVRTSPTLRVSRHWSSPLAALRSPGICSSAG